jgi:hypothetical protein
MTKDEAQSAFGGQMDFLPSRQHCRVHIERGHPPEEGLGLFYETGPKTRKVLKVISFSCLSFTALAVFSTIATKLLSESKTLNGPTDQS